MPWDALPPNDVYAGRSIVPHVVGQSTKSLVKHDTGLADSVQESGSAQMGGRVKMDRRSSVERKRSAMSEEADVTTMSSVSCFSSSECRVPLWKSNKNK